MEILGSGLNNTSYKPISLFERGGLLYSTQLSDMILKKRESKIKFHVILKGRKSIENKISHTICNDFMKTSIQIRFNIFLKTFIKI